MFSVAVYEVKLQKFEIENESRAEEKEENGLNFSSAATHAYVESNTCSGREGFRL